MWTMGDNVIVINAEKVVLTGNKYTDKKYYRHTGYPGGIKEPRPTRFSMAASPSAFIEKAVERMMPGGPLEPRPAVEPAHLWWQRTPA
jgi:large subunit ribosomal protein L13